MSSLKIKYGPVFQKNWEADTKIVVNQGGTRSGKTYSLLQLLIVQSYQTNGKIYSIVRKSLPSLKMTAYRDFFEILNNLGVYDEKNHNKSDYTYNLNGNLFEFISLDQPQKKRGARRDVLFCNEANELTWEDFFQLLVRTTDRIYIDYNPSDSFHWIYDRLLTRDDVTYIQTTYKDNPFLDQTIVDEIERLKYTDEDYWRIYGLGERGMSRATIFQFQIAEEPKGQLISLGLDFGFTNDPTALVEVVYQEGKLWVKELLYETGLTNADIARRCGLQRSDEIIADSAEPKSIEEIRRSGCRIRPVTKGADSIRSGIDKLKSVQIMVHQNSVNVIRELRNYAWKRDYKTNQVTNQAEDDNNHALDALRYVAMEKLKTNSGKYLIR